MTDERLLAIAIERMSIYDETKTIPMDEVNRELGITEDDLIGFNEIEFE